MGLISKLHLMVNLYKLKALFNNVSTFKNLSCMALHATSVFDKVNMKPWKNYFKASLSASKE